MYSLLRPNESSLATRSNFRAFFESSPAAYDRSEMRTLRVPRPGAPPWSSGPWATLNPLRRNGAFPLGKTFASERRSPPVATISERPALNSAAVRWFVASEIRSAAPSTWVSLDDTTSGNTLSHIDPVTGAPTMVDVAEKSLTTRVAVAESTVFLPEAVMKLIGESLGSQFCGSSIPC